MLANLISLLLGILGSLIATFIFPPLQDLLNSFFMNLFSWVTVKKRYNFKGTWKSSWSVDSDKFPKNVEDSNATIKQVGSRIYARFDAEGLDCYLIGKIDSGRYITGTWYEVTEGGYHGAFQFFINPLTKNFSGKWVGYSTKGEIKEGDWDWIRTN